MPFKVSVLSNCDDVFLAWNPGDDIPHCLGFKIERRLNGTSTVLDNRVGFTDSPLPEQGAASSADYPFQRLSWTDHGPRLGDRLAYRVTARIGTPGSLRDGPSSDWTEEITLSATCGDSEAYFNRGVVLSQFVAHLMQENGWNAADIKAHAGEVHDKLREFLSGELRLALLRLLQETRDDADGELYAALFELSDPELVPALAALGDRAHVVLGNGAVKSKGDDENAAARAALKAAGVDVRDRMSAPTFLAHNKFCVLTRKGQPEIAWTGSTNWQPTGLCTQANNGILIRDGGFATDFRAAWERLADAGNDHPPALKADNTVNPPAVYTLPDQSSAYAQFTAVTAPHKGYQALDISELLDLIAGAKQSLLFAMFMPGEQIFEAAVNRGSDIFVRGVANTFPKDTLDQPSDDSHVSVDMINNGQRREFGLDVVRPANFDSFAEWAAEITTQQFNAIGHAIIHSKVLVIDAWGDRPTLVTGSHNFSKTASTSNDENFIVITGNRALAQAYAVNCLGLYDHYRWREYVSQTQQQGRKPWSHLSGDPDWLEKYRQDKDRLALLKALGLA